MSDSNTASNMIDVAINILTRNSKDDAINLLRVCKEWADVGATPYRIDKIVSFYGATKHPPQDISYDSKLSKCISEVYADAACKGAYVSVIIDLCIAAHRGYDLIYDIASYGVPTKSDFDIVPYISDTKWSDGWIKEIKNSTSSIRSGREHGYEPLKIFTPEHNPDTFHNVKSLLFGSSRKNIIPTYWLSDINWSPDKAHAVVVLYDDVPSIDWGLFVKPYTSMHAIDELVERANSSIAVEMCNAILKYWDNVTPKLDYILSKDDHGWSYDEKRGLYNDYKVDYGCDGDELADCVLRGKYPDDVIAENDYWHRAHAEHTDSGVGDITSNSPAIQSAMQKMIGG